MVVVVEMVGEMVGEMVVKNIYLLIDQMYIQHLYMNLYFYN